MDMASPRLRDCVLMLAACLVVLKGPLAAQDRENAHFTRISINEGLTQAAIKAILQDHHGFIWVGTEEGLNRYDGAGFLNFYHEPENPTTLPHNWVSCLLEDANQNLWIGTLGGGIARFDETSQSFISYQHDQDDPNSLSSNRIRTLTEDSKGHFWIGTQSAGLNFFDPSTGNVIRYQSDPLDKNTISSNRIRSIVEDDSGMIWIGTDGGGLNMFNPFENRVVRIETLPSGKKDLPSKRIRILYIDQQGFLWIGSYDGFLTKMDLQSGDFEVFTHNPEGPFSLSPGKVITILQDSRGVLWVGSEGGGLNRKGPADSFDHYTHNPGDQHSLSDNRLFCLYEDRSGVLWVGTYGGLHSWNAQIGSFSHYKPGPGNSDTLHGKQVTAFARSMGAVWIGTRDAGLNRLDPKTGAFKHYTEKEGLAHANVTALLNEGDASLWIGTQNGLNNLDYHTESFTHYQHEQQDAGSLSHNNVTGLVHDKKGQLWVATSPGGLHLFNPQNNRFTRYPNGTEEDPDTDPSNRLFAEGNSALLLAANYGLQRFSLATNSFSLIKNDPQNPRSLSANQVLSVCESIDGALWLGTLSGGLNKWSASDREASIPEFTHVTIEQGLPSNNIYGIQEDPNGNLWLSSDQGLVSFNPVKGTVFQYGVFRGLQGAEFIPNATMKDKDGRLYFGGTNGFNVFFPQAIKRNEFVPPVVLTSFSSNSRLRRFQKPFSKVSDITLSHRDHVITLGFAALEFTRPQANKYMHQLEGFDPNWIDLGNHNQVTYTNLPPNDYVFKVKAANHDGVWNTQPLQIGLTVKSPPWKSFWAYLIYSMLILFAWAFWLRLQNQKLNQEVERRNQLQMEVRARTSELEQQHYTLEKLNKQLEESNLTDHLTGLKNRRYMVHFVQENLFQFGAGDFSEGGVDPEWMFLVVNLDRFRVLNDRFGHATGDMILVQARQILDNIRSESDLLIRWDSDEFVLLTRSPDSLGAQDLAERVRQGVELHTFTLGNGKSARLTCSIGFAFYPFSSQKPGLLTWHQVMMVADRALYLAKRNGLNAWAGITCGEYTPPDNFIDLIKTSPRALAASGAFELMTSFPPDLNLKWD